MAIAALGNVIIFVAIKTAIICPEKNKKKFGSFFWNISSKSIW